MEVEKMKAVNVHPIAAALAFALATPATTMAEEPADTLYIDNHYHVQAFHATGAPLEDFIKMMDENKISRSAAMTLAITTANNPLNDPDGYDNVYYYQTDDQNMYYNPIQDVNLATKVVRLTPDQRKRFIPMMCAFNMKDANAGEYIKDMIRAFPGVFDGFGELHFKKAMFMPKIPGGPLSLRSPSIKAVFDTIQGELGAFAVVHCDADAPGITSLAKEDYGPVIFGGKVPEPKWQQQFIDEVLVPNNKAPLIWSHFGGMARSNDVGPRENHWEVMDKVLSDPRLNHVYFDLSWGAVYTDALFDTPEHTKKTIDLVKKHPKRFIYGSDQGGAPRWDLVKPSFDTWQPLWDALTDEEKRMIRVDNFAKIVDQSAANIRAWEKKNATGSVRYSDAPIHFAY
jgi:hypothetical protein